MFIIIFGEVKNDYIYFIDECINTNSTLIVYFNLFNNCMLKKDWNDFFIYFFGN